MGGANRGFQARGQERRHSWPGRERERGACEVTGERERAVRVLPEEMVMPCATSPTVDGRV